MKPRKSKKKNKKKKIEMVNSFNNSNLKSATSAEIEVDSIITNCLIDTGAYTSFISDRYASSRKLTRDKVVKQRRWITANGTPIDIAGQTTLSLKIGKQIFQAPFIIAKNLAQDVIIGVDILKANSCVVDFKNNKLVCNNEFIEIKSPGSSKSKTIYANENINIEPFKRDTFLFNCPINEETVLVNRLGRINILETITDRNKSNGINITIENPTDKRIAIRKGDPICRVSSCKVICSIKNEQELVNFIHGDEVEIVNNINMVKSKPWKPSGKLKFTNNKLSNDQVKKIKDLCDNYWMCFSRNESDIGTVREEYGTHDIILNNEKPLSSEHTKYHMLKSKW